MSKPINVYSIPELRQTLIDALPGVFSRLKYTQSYRLIDTKLFFGYSIAAVAGISFLLDKKFEYGDVLLYQKLLLGVYTVLCLIYWHFTTYTEKGINYVGVSKEGEKITVKSYFEDGEPIYRVEFRKSDGVELNTAVPVNKLFTEAGYLQSDIFYEWIDQQVKILCSKKGQ